MECRLCGEEFSGIRSLNQHIRSEHQGVLACSRCGERFYSRSRLNEHHVQHDAVRTVDHFERGSSPPPPLFDDGNDFSEKPVSTTEGNMAEFLQLHYRHGLSHRGLDSVRNIVVRRIDQVRSRLAERIPEHATMITEQVTDFVESSIELSKTSTARFLRELHRGIPIQEECTNSIVWHRYSLMEWLGFVLESHPSLLEDIAQHTALAASTDDYVSMASGSVYRTHPVLSSGKSVALCLYFDFAVTTLNALGKAARADRNYAVLMGVIANSPSHHFKKDAAFVLSVIPKPEFEEVGMNRFLSPFVAELRSLSEGEYMVYICALCSIRCFCVSSSAYTSLLLLVHTPSCICLPDLFMLCIGVRIHNKVVIAHLLAVLGDNEAQQCLALLTTSSASVGFCRQCTSTYETRLQFQRYTYSSRV